MSDPLERFRAPVAAAPAQGGARPEAAALATADERGRPSVRMVLLKGTDDRGFVFYTNLGSRKAKELAVQPWASLCFHWLALEEQVRVEGPTERVSDAEADAYFASRPRGSQLGAWASKQSEALGSREVLEARLREVEARFAGRPVERPPFWSGFRVLPERIEFWKGRPDRLHVRDVYLRQPAGWTGTVLYP